MQGGRFDYFTSSVIFNPIKKLTPRHPVYSLAEKNIAAICIHTNLDIAQNGTNGVILKMLSEKFSFAKEPEPFEELGNGLISAG